MSEWNVTVTIDTRREETPDVHVLGVVLTLCHEAGGHPLTIHLSNVKLKDFRGCHPSVVLPYTVMFVDGLDEAIRTAIIEEVENSVKWNIPDDAVIQEARERVKSLIDFLASHGQSLGFDDTNDTLFIAPKGMRWIDRVANGNSDEYVPVTAEELDYRTENCDLCSGKICFCHTNDTTDYLEKCGLRKAK